MHTPSLADYVACLERGDLPGVADLMLASAEKLARIGADFLICPDNTIHEALPLVLPRSPLPWLHIAEVVAAEAAARGFRRLGITGTRWLVDSEVYPEVLAARGFDYLRPTAAERDETNRIIMEELVYDKFQPDSVAYFQRVIARMKDDGCDAVILGCTEIPLIISDANCTAADPRFHAVACACCVAASGARHGGRRLGAGPSFFIRHGRAWHDHPRVSRNRRVSAPSKLVDGRTKSDHDGVRAALAKEERALSRSRATVCGPGRLSVQRGDTARARQSRGPVLRRLPAASTASATARAPAAPCPPRRRG